MKSVRTRFTITFFHTGSLTMCEHCMNRREFAAMTTAGLAGGMLGLSAALAAEGQGIEPGTRTSQWSSRAGRSACSPSWRMT